VICSSFLYAKQSFRKLVNFIYDISVEIMYHELRGMYTSFCCFDSIEECK